jgi:hypothetical protein
MGETLKPSKVRDKQFARRFTSTESGKKSVPNQQWDEDATVEKLALTVNALCRTATLDLSFKVGEAVIGALYEGKIGLWGSVGTGRASYRKLASREDLVLSPSALCRAVGVYVLCHRLGGRATWRHLSTSHLQEVLPLDAEQQEKLVCAAEAERWTVARIRAEVTKLREVPRKRRDNLEQAIQALRRLLARHRETFGAVILGDLDASSARVVCDLVAMLKLQAEVLEGGLRNHRTLPSKGPT